MAFRNQPKVKQNKVIYRNGYGALPKTAPSAKHEDLPSFTNGDLVSLIFAAWVIIEALQHSYETVQLLRSLL